MTGQSSDIHAWRFAHQREGVLAAHTAPVIASGNACSTKLSLEWLPSRARARGSRATRSPLSSKTPACALQRPASRHIILFIAANPSDSTRLGLDAECAAIEHELRMTLGRDDFDFRSKWAVNIDEMMRHLNECQPTIVHFSGHGGQACRAAEASRDTGIRLQGEHEYVNERALAQMIASAAPSTRVVVLNACF